MGDYLAESPPTFVPSIRKLPDNILHFPTEDKYEEKFSTARKLELERLGVCEDCYWVFLFFTQSFMKFLKTEYEAEPFFLPEIHDVVCKCTKNKCGGKLVLGHPKIVSALRKRQKADMSVEKILKCENCGDSKSIKKKIEEGINVRAQRFGSTPYSDVKNDINNYLYRGVDPDNYLTDLSDEKKYAN